MSSGWSLETPRLQLRHLALEDAPFILELVNDPDWHRYIGDRGIRDLEGARGYLESGPLQSYREHGYGLYRVQRQEDRVPLGICGLITRPELPAPDVGFAFLPAHRKQGYASEAMRAVLEHGVRDFGMRRILAITSLDNRDSIRVLERGGFVFEELVPSPDGDEELRLFAYVPEESGV